MGRATRRVTDPFELSAVSKFNGKVKLLPDETRLRPHPRGGRRPKLREFRGERGRRPPFEAVFGCCCEAAIQRELEFTSRTPAR